jgi:hypothetical protein
MSKVKSDKQDKLVSINGKPIWYRYKVTRVRKEYTDWEIDSTVKLDKNQLRSHCNWREMTGGNKDFPYGLRDLPAGSTHNVDYSVDVGHGPELVDYSDEDWEYELQEDNNE